MAVHGYLRTVGQLKRYNRRDVLEHLDACISQQTTTRVFVSKYITQVRFSFPALQTSCRPTLESYVRLHDFSSFVLAFI